MWIRDIDTGKWSIYQDQFSKDNYDKLKQDLESIKFYSKCLSGATYLLINQFENIYENLSYKNSGSWFINTSASIYSTNLIPPNNGISIDKLSIDNSYQKYIKDYGFSLKTFFTPYKLISESAENFIQVDVATTPPDFNNIDVGVVDVNLNLNVDTINLTIDGVRLLEGHRVLVKDQVTFIELSNSINPDNYFIGPYYVHKKSTTSTTYYFYNDQNGIYIFRNNRLVRTDDMDTYDRIYNLSVSVKQGDLNRDKQFHLSRLRSGYFPEVSKSEPIEFKEKHNWVLRNRVDYNNVLDINYYDVLKHATQSYVVNSYTYSIPQRTVAVGEFGIIINNQDRFTGMTYSFSHIINNRYKVNLRGITETSGYYWICGDEGNLLKVSKVDFSITKIELNELRDFKSIDFFNDNRGVLVGKFNTIYFTQNGGYNWSPIEFSKYESYCYNKVIFTELDTFYVVGDNGVFIQFSNVTGEWISYLRKINKVVKKDDVYPLVDDLYDIIKVNLDSWNLNYSTTASTYTISNVKEALMISGANSNLIVYDYNNFIKEHDFIFLSWLQPIGDIKSLSNKKGTVDFRLASDSIYEFNINEFESIDTVSNSIVSPGVKIFKSSVIGSAGNPLNLNLWQQISPTAFSLEPSPGHPGGKLWSYISPTWSSDQFIVSHEGFTSSWTRAIATASYIQSGSIIDFYAPVSYFGGTWTTTTQHASWVALNPTYIADMVGYMDRLWLIGQKSDDSWTLVQECSQILDPSGIPAYTIKNYRTSESYKSIGFIINQEPPLVKNARGRKQNVPDFAFLMGEISEFTITVEKPTIVEDYYVNKIFDFNGIENIIVGNNSLIRSSNYSTDYFVLDPTIENKLKPKLLFLDYDIASKLNFFDDNGDYRLPNSVTFSGLTAINTSISISNLGYEYNWLDYYKDAEKTFRYYSSFDDSNKIVFSSTFSYHLSGTSSFTFSKANLSISLGDILPFAPTIVSKTQSRYVSGSTPLPSSPVGLTFSVYLYKYLGIFRVPTTSPYSEGDVLHFSSDIVDTKLVINRILNIGSFNYLYTYTEFNESILNSLKNSNSTYTLTNLNKYQSISQLIDRFELHPISIGYKLDSSGTDLVLSCRFNNKTAYYNMQSKVFTTSNTYEMKYQDSFLKFGFSPTYNILDYLNNINPGFTASKVFYSMPKYTNMPGNNGGTFTNSNIYLDGSSYQGVIGAKTNKLIFGTNFEFEWKSFWINTFVDVILTTTSGVHTSTGLLITNKYYDSNLNAYIIEFDKALTYNTNDDLQLVEINSRNTLGQISNDLKILNNIQRKISTKSIQTSNTFSGFENQLTSKFSTDSYCKILLSDGLIKENVSAIIYVDDKYQLSMNVLELEKKIKTNIIGVENYGGNILVTCDAPHNLNSGDGVVLTFTGGTFSSQYINPQYNGFQTVEYLNEYQFITTREFGLTTPVSDSGYVEFIKKDAFFNYKPTDIYDLGVDKVSKVAVEITPINIELIGNQFNLVNLDMSKYKYELFDGLSLEDLIRNYHWILEAEISNAKIGKRNSELVWYSGIWKCGRWFGGIWISGTWVKGDWYNGIWNALSTTNKVINIEIGNQQISNLSKWYDGRWFDGTWYSGIWYNGRRYAGDWYDGTWYNGIWNNGNWYNGVFSGGVWVLGNWKGGIFNSNNKPAYWLDGKWSGGDFENGRWFNGQFSSENGSTSRFGTKASNSRNAIWDSGKWLSGDFYSFLNVNDEGLVVASDIHKYSYFKTGIWNRGNFYGGVIYNINFRGGNFYGGIVDDIQVIGVNINQNQITLNGIFRFNIGDEIWIVDDGTSTSDFLKLGQLSDPKKYKIAFVTIDEVLQTTTLLLLYDLSSYGTFAVYSQFGFDLKLRVVSKFSNTNWYSGLWYNGIFENGKFLGGMWYNGYFNGDWGQ
jgi:hypothetical protein